MKFVGGAIPLVVSEEGKCTREEYDFSGVVSIKTASVPFVGSEGNDGGKSRGKSLKHSSKFDYYS